MIKYYCDWCKKETRYINVTLPEKVAEYNDDLNSATHQICKNCINALINYIRHQKDSPVSK